MAERRISYAPDVENGDHSRREHDEGNLDEYTALNRYISTARDGRRGSTSSAGARSVHEKKKSKFAFWKKDADATGSFVCPDEWLETDLRTGLPSSEIEMRRKKGGWNELTTEKTNFFIQFIGYFRGPILYGMLPIPLRMEECPCQETMLTIVATQLWNWLFFWLLVFVTGLIWVSFAVFCCSTLSSVGTRRSRLPTSSPV
jgi:hypothetical protein